jgi:chemotaxis protein CheY-P-specific phosphatase CheC
VTLKRDALESLAQSCAGRAAAALGDLLGRKLRPEAIRLVSTAVSDLAEHLPGDAPRAAVLAELEGSTVGRIALVVPSTAAGEAIQSLVERRARGRRAGLASDLLAASALLEMGNIAFSAAANALADAIGGRVFPSVPRFSSDPAADLAQGWLGEADALVSQLELLGTGDPLQVQLVWLPDLGSWT